PRLAARCRRPPPLTRTCRRAKSAPTRQLAGEVPCNPRRRTLRPAARKDVQPFSFRDASIVVRLAANTYREPRAGGPSQTRRASTAIGSSEWSVRAGREQRVFSARNVAAGPGGGLEPSATVLPLFAPRPGR